MNEQQKFMSDFLKGKGVDSVDNASAEQLAEGFHAWNENQIEGIKKAAESDRQVMRDEFQAGLDKQRNELNIKLAEMGVKLVKAEKVSDKSETPKGVFRQLRDNLEANKDKLKALKEGSRNDAQNNSFEFQVKVAGTMTNSNISGGNIPVEERLTGFNLVPSRTPRLINIMAQRTTNNPLVSWVYQANKDGTAGQTAEASAKNQIDFDLVVDSETAKKTTAYIKVTTEMMDDIDWLMGEIQDELFREILKAVEQQAYDGDGTGQNHNGIATQASAFSAGTFANAVDNANVVDVWTVAANQIFVAQEGNATPNYILVHPDTLAGLMVEKLSATDKRYIDRLIDTAGNLSLRSSVGIIPIIPTTLITTGDYLMGDFMKSMLVTRQGLSFEIGLDGNDFTENLRTVLAEWRGMTIIKNNDTTCFVAGTIATDAAALETA